MASYTYSPNPFRRSSVPLSLYSTLRIRFGHVRRFRDTKIFETIPGRCSNQYQKGTNTATASLMHLPLSQTTTSIKSHHSQTKSIPSNPKPGPKPSRQQPPTVLTMKLLPLTLLLSAFKSLVLAERILTYTCYGAHQSRPEDRDGRWKFGGAVSDALADKLVKKMAEWSSGQYTAETHWPSTGGVHVGCSEKTGRQTDHPAEEIAEMERIIAKHKDD